MKEDVSILLTDRKFQRVLNEWGNYQQGAKDGILQSYFLSEDEMQTLLQLWASLRFHSKELTPPIIEEALEETIWNLAEKNVSEKKTSFRKKLYLQFSKVAAVLLLPLIVYTILLQIQNEKTFFTYNNEQIVTVTSQPGTISNIILPDGSKVYLNSGSSITYPSQFVGNTRDVQLSGEAFFDVVKNSEMPMLLSTDNIKLKVYGTSFNVNAFPDEETERITLVEGSISMSGKIIKDKGHKELFLKPGQTASVNNKEDQLIVKNEDPFPYIAWKDGILVFRNTYFQSVLFKLSRKFNVDIELKNPSLAQIPLDATFNDENVNEILRLLSLSVPFRFYYGKNKKLEDGTFEKSKIYIVKR